MDLASINISLAQEVAKNSKIELYGLFSLTSWDSCIMNFMILTALDYNTNLNVLTDDQINCFNSLLNGYNNSSNCNCLT